jgi:hypothetical protein
VILCLCDVVQVANSQPLLANLLYSLRPEISCAGENFFELHAILQKRPGCLKFEAIKSRNQLLPAMHAIRPRSAPPRDPAAISARA